MCVGFQLKNMITILFAYRNRDVTRVRLSLESLQNQTKKGFKVLFIDYGSDDDHALEVKKIVDQFEFASYLYVGHPGLLWNKSKALNYGIRQATSEFIVTADVDVLFTDNFIETILSLTATNSYTLFKIGYLSKQITEQQQNQLNFETIKTTHVGNTYGIGLYPKSVLEHIGGLDEFFHFYGSEDEDMNLRVQLSGVKLVSCDELMLYHQWHPRYPKKKDNKLTIQPRLKNVLRINQRHFLQHKTKKKIVVNGINWGMPVDKKQNTELHMPKAIIKLNNMAAFIIHFFEEELPKLDKDVYEIIIEEDPYYKTLKYKLKVFLGKQTQPYMSMKEINDLILKNIVFRYRDYNYAYVVSDNLKKISFSIDLNFEC